MKFIIDRFEGEFAVVELPDRKTISLPKAAIPPEAKEGDVLSLVIESEETAARKAAIQSKIKNLFQD